MPGPDQIREGNLLREREFREYVLLLESLFVGISGVGVAYLITVPNLQLAKLIVVVPASVCAVIGLFVTWGVYRMRPWTRVPLTILCIAGLPFFPFGTIFSLLILRIAYLSEAPQFLTKEYFDLVCKTKHLNPRTSLLTWVGVILLLLLFIAIVLISLLPKDVRVP